jgi:hypothetical protein
LAGTRSTFHLNFMRFPGIGPKIDLTGVGERVVTRPGSTWSAGLEPEHRFRGDAEGVRVCDTWQCA